MGGSFEGKVVWITGASAGIGRELAREFAKRGADVALSARRIERIEELAAELRGLGCRSVAVPCDVTDEAVVSGAAEKVVAELGRMDVAVANAGFGVTGALAEVPIDDFRRQLETNVIGVMTTVQAALPHLRETKGRLALVGSVSAMLPSPKSGPYSASKYAVRAIGQTLSIELAGTGVTCTTLHPGFVSSEIAQVDNRGQFSADRKDNRPAGLMWPTEKAARVMVDAIAKRKREFVFTAHGRLGAWLGRHLPGLVHAAMSRSR
jgi:NAD(P)-dependent dehydrogenase (short-subunit alcohol dehydrogenase family)